MQRGSHTQRSRRRHINVNAHVHVSAPRAPAQCGGATKAAPRRLFRWGSGPTSPPNHSPLEGPGTTQAASPPPSPFMTSVRASAQGTRDKSRLNLFSRRRTPFGAAPFIVGPVRGRGLTSCCMRAGDLQPYDGLVLPHSCQSAHAGHAICSPVPMRAHSSSPCRPLVSRRQFLLQLILGF